MAAQRIEQTVFVLQLRLEVGALFGIDHLLWCNVGEQPDHDCVDRLAFFIATMQHFTSALVSVKSRLQMTLFAAKQCRLGVRAFCTVNGLRE